MSARIVDPSELAETYREALRDEVAQLAAEGRTIRVTGLLAEQHGPAAVYAEYAAKGAASVGIEFDLRRVDASNVEAELGLANGDPDVNGVFLYYPIQGDADRWLREMVDPRKDIEGMHSFWSRYLYENRRYLDEERTQQAILPCTPLAILKLLDAAGLRDRARAAQGGPSSAPLAGVRAVVINRSDIVGRPLSAMLANDGAEVVSIDIEGSVLFEPAIGRRAHEVRSCSIERAEALADADVIVTGVPSRDFELITADEIKPGAICANFSQFKNFDASVLERASAFIPRVGPMTVTMAMRNAVRVTRTLQARG